MTNQSIKLLGLVGKPLSHSFSQLYFTNKFQSLGLTSYQYLLFELPSIDHFPRIVKENPNLIGLNVTIPYKRSVIRYLDQLSPQAEKIGAVNVIKITTEGKLIGYNTDYLGFKESLQKWLGTQSISRSLVLGTGGASLAVVVALRDIGIEVQQVSRTAKEEIWDYRELSSQDVLTRFPLIVNTTPLGMAPEVETCPDLPYNQLGNHHFLYDLVYNPETTEFMKRGMQAGASVKNGLEMLHLQAEKGWDIWNN